MKVYELAKKLNVKSVFLMDKIRKEWKLPVQTYMQTLTPEQAKEIEERFYKSQKPPAEAKKPGQSKAKTTKKKSARKTSLGPARVRKVVVKKTGAKEQKTLANKQAKEKPSSSNLGPQAKTAPKRKIIIRRKKIEDEMPAVDKARASKSPSPKEGSAPVKIAEPSPTPASASKNIRLDLVSVKNKDPLEDDFWDKKEKAEDPAKSKPRKPIAEKDVSSKFYASDFRKREVIFQPRKKRATPSGEFKSTPITTPKSHKRIVKVHGEMSLDSLSQKMGLKRQTLVKKCKEEGLELKPPFVLDFETIALIIPSFGFEAKNTQKTEKEILDTLEKKPDEEKSSPLAPKPPVVTIMGHVDHGKTTLLDCIRKTRVAKGEAGGITQHLGAYSVFSEGKPITFIDTPGHSAFTAMRGRGAKVTDIVVIVVSADDGVMPQTIEALNHAKAAQTPVIVAISKMDVDGANPDKIKQQMSEQGLVPEDWGGDTAFIPISAVKGDGLSDLLERILLLAEIQELKCRPHGPARGVVLEARKEKGLGCVVSFLVRDGSLKTGQPVLAGEHIGRIRQLKDDKGKMVSSVGPGFPIEVMGLQDIPSAGSLFHTVTDEKAAKELLALRQNKSEPVPLEQQLSPEEMLLKLSSEGDKKPDLNVILKADVKGSLEAIQSSLENIKSDEVSLKIVHSAVGPITKSDVLLASAMSGALLGFNVRPDGQAQKCAKAKSISIYTYSVIYELLDQAQKLMLGLLGEESVEEDIGQAEVREIFHISKVGTVAGCYVTSGQITKSSFIRLVRDGRLIHNGPLLSLKRFKEDVRQVGTGFECGISLKNFNDIKPKDILESYIKKEQARTAL